MVHFSPVSGWDYAVYSFVLNGTVGAVDTKADGSRYIPRSYTITKVILHIESNGGTGGNTIVDVNKNGTTIFTTQPNRPTVAFDAGDNVTEEVTNMDVTSIEGGDILTVDVDEIVTGGNVKDIQVEVVCRGRGGG